MSAIGLNIMHRIQTEINNNIAQSKVDVQGNDSNVNNAAEAAEAAQEQQNSNTMVEALSLFDSDTDAKKWHNEYVHDFMPFCEEYAGGDYSDERYLIDCNYYLGILCDELASTREEAQLTYTFEEYEDDIDELNEKYSVDEDSLMDYVSQRNDDLDEEVSFK